MTKQELATKIWATANELRKNIKASEYKDYILGFMFYKFLCDKEVDYLHSLGGDEEDLKDADENTKKKFQDGIGYFITYENLFSVWKKSGTNLGAKDVAESLDDFYQNLNEKHKKVFDKVFSALQSGLTKLGENSGSRDKAVRDIVDLVDIIPPTSRNYDVLGYIYEYLIQQFSSEAKKDGAFYTPHELTSLMSRIIAERLKDKTEVSCYDPTVGSGGLLLNIGKEVGKYVPRDNIKYYGQELITETANLAKMNLFMQGIPVSNIHMRNANTLAEDWPYFDESTDYEPLLVSSIASNPPYSAKYDPDSHITDERFKGYGLAPAGKADYAFLLHCLYHIKPDGIMTIVLPHGVLFRGDSEGEIRKNLLLNHNIETIIGVPSSLFFATQIPVCVIILSKNREKDDVLFIDASQSFRKDKKQNVLRESDVQRIFDAVVARKEIPNFAHLATLDEIKGNDYNLNVPRYISAAKENDACDLYSEMTGKVSDRELDSLSAIWAEFPELRAKLVKGEGEYHTLSTENCKTVVNEDAHVRKFLDAFHVLSDEYRQYMVQQLIRHDATPDVHTELVDTLFKRFKNYPLIDSYSVFQAFADNWETIDMDIARIEAEGWGICSESEPHMVTKKDSKTKEMVEEQKGWKGKIIPFDLVKKEFFAADFEKMEALNRDADGKASEYADIWENMDEEAKSAVAKDEDESAYDNKKFKAAIKSGALSTEAVAGLNDMLVAMAAEKELRKKVKDAVTGLESKAKEKLEALTEDEVKMLLEKKWISPVISAINGTADKALNDFAAAFTALEKKYANPLDDLSKQISETSAKLKESLDGLTGSETDMAAIKMLMEVLG